MGTIPTTTIHLEKAIEEYLTSALEDELRKLGVTEEGKEIPVAELVAEPQMKGFGGFGGFGAWPPEVFAKAFPSAFRKAVAEKEVPIIQRPGKPPAVNVTKAEVLAQTRPWIEETAAKMADTVRTSIKKVTEVSRPTAEKEMLPPGTILQLRREVVEDVEQSIPEAAVEGGMFGLGTFVTPGLLRRAPAVAGGNIGGRFGAEESAEDVDYDLEEGARGFGQDIERGAAVFGQDIRRGAAAFDDFITSLDVEDAATVSGLGRDDVEAGAAAFDGGAFGQDIERGAAAFGQADITTGARAFDQFLTASEVESARAVSGLGRMVSTAAHPGARGRTVWSDTFVPYEETDWSEMQYPRGGVYEDAVRPPTPATTAKVAAAAVKQGVKVLEETKSPAKTVVALAKMGVKAPNAGVGKARTAGEAAYKAVVNGLNRYATMRWGVGAIRKAKEKAPLQGLSGLEGPSIDGSLF